MNMFIEPTPEQAADFRQWARDNYTLLTPIKGIWHPCVQAECALMNKAAEARHALTVDIYGVGC